MAVPPETVCMYHFQNTVLLNPTFYSYTSMYLIRKFRLQNSINEDYMVSLSESYHTQSSISEQVMSQASKTVSGNNSNSFVISTNGQVELTNLKMRIIFKPTWIIATQGIA